MKSLEHFLTMTKDRVDLELSRPLESTANKLEATSEAMYYMINAGGGGKRLRPAIVMAILRGFGGDEVKGMHLARAVEYLHTYTLILDDIQDGSPLRRGVESCHIRFGVNTALLAAGRLFERGLRPFHQYSDSVLFESLCDRLHMGQAADLNVPEWEPDLLTLDNLRFIQAGKTGALIQMAILGGCLSSGLSTFQTERLLEYGHYLGLAYQAKDDLLCRMSNEETLGKPAGLMVDRNKLTYGFFYDNPDRLYHEAEKLVAEARQRLEGFQEGQVYLLAMLADHILSRNT